MCDCGNYKTTLGQNLKRGLTTSCGCYGKEIRSIVHKKYNIYEIDENNTNITKVYFTNTDGYFICDSEDVNKIKEYTWMLSTRETVVTTFYIDDKLCRIYVYNLIMNPQEDEIVDHINGKRLDNRKNNLRICTQIQNSYNQKIREDNTSGHKGVYWDKSRNKWASQITAETITHYLGRFDKFEEAVNAYEQAELKYFKEYGTKISRNGYI